MDKISFLGSENEMSRVPFGSILKETREKTTVENEDTLLSCAINGIFRNDELFSHFRGSSNIGYIKIKKNDLILSAQNLHLGNANVNLRFEHGIISPAYKVYRITGAEPEYIAQWVKRPATNQFFLDATTEGASQCRKNIDWDALYKQCIELPSLEEQKEISKLLMSLDSKIAFEKTEVRKLKDFKSAMLTKMFPKKGENVPEIRFDGFTDAWEQRKLGEICDFITKGATPTTYGFSWQPDGVPFFRNDSIKDNIFVFGEFSYISEAANEVLKRSEVHGNDILIAITGDIGKVGIIPDTVEKANINQHIARVRIRKDALPYFVYQYLASDDTQKEYQKIKTGLSMPQLSLEQVRDIVVKIPEFNEQGKIAECLRSIDTLITLHQRKYEKLIDTKKAFLVKLIGGEK